MSNVRDIWHFKPQNILHQEMSLLSIVNFFAIVLQCNSKDAKYCKFFCNSATMQFYLKNCTVAQF